MNNKVCPLGLIARGGYGCYENQCMWTDKNGECLIKGVLSGLKDCLQANKPKELNPVDIFAEFLTNYPIQKKEEK